VDKATLPPYSDGTEDAGNGTADALC